jgi:hypothetical protein
MVCGWVGGRSVSEGWVGGGMGDRREEREDKGGV